MHERFGVTLANGLGNPVPVELTASEPAPETLPEPRAGAPAEPRGDAAEPPAEA